MASLNQELKQHILNARMKRANEEYDIWLKENGITESKFGCLSADDLKFHPDLTKAQRDYLTAFSARWEYRIQSVWRNGELTTHEEIETGNFL